MSWKNRQIFNSFPKKALLVWALSLSWGLSAWAENSAGGPLFSPSSCLPEFMALSLVSTVDPTQPTKSSHPLQSENIQGRFSTPVELRVQVEPGDFKEGDQQLRLQLGFREDFSGVSLPYNLFALLIIQNDQPLLWLDLTSGCQDPGVSVFPGQEWILPSLTWWGSGGDFDRLQIMVWGRL